MNIFFFGGTFDPPHKAHKLIYKYCIDLCDKFIFIPTAQSPEKQIPLASDEQRINMLELLIDSEDTNKVLIDRFEIDSDKKPNYTINTIIYLKKKFSDSSIHMVVGRDQYENLSNWKDYNKIIKEVKIICFNRSFSELNYQKHIDFIDFNCEISSTEIRKKIASGKLNKIKNFLTKEINHLICDNGLYVN
tara:strand:+ start:633 stop:1202 length:570 start_codon:yes stop_codon:yes gene_type:complete